MTRTPTAHTWLVRALFGILILYSACMLWPAYHSGLAFFSGDPKWEWRQPYAVWYLREGTLEPSPLDWLILDTALLSTPAALFGIPLVETRYEHIVLDEEQIALIAGTTMKVRELVAERYAYGWSAEELQYKEV